MVMQHAKPGRVALAVMGALLVTALPAKMSYAEGFIDDSTLTGGSITGNVTVIEKS
ncbi:Uncharacterised protein [Proteus mirabilis]|nr:Uncharacterised protein [Proteus mirabilis]